MTFIKFVLAVYVLGKKLQLRYSYKHFIDLLVAICVRVHVKMLPDVYLSAVDNQ